MTAAANGGRPDRTHSRPVTPAKGSRPRGQLMSLAADRHSIAPRADRASSHSPVAPSRPWRWPSINITPAERAGRAVLGFAIVVTAVVLLTSAAATLAMVLEVLLLGSGLDLVATGALGHCPLYQRLGHMPKSLRRPT